MVREKLFTGHVIRVGEHMIDVKVRGERCTLDRIDRATAMAAIEVHREAQVDLSKAVPDPENSSRGAGNAYKTVFMVQAADVEAMIQERKAKFKEARRPGARAPTSTRARSARSRSSPRWSRRWRSAGFCSAPPRPTR